MISTYAPYFQAILRIQELKSELARAGTDRGKKYRQ